MSDLAIELSRRAAVLRRVGGIVDLCHVSRHWMRSTGRSPNSKGRWLWIETWRALMP